MTVFWVNGREEDTANLTSLALFGLEIYKDNHE